MLIRLRVGQAPPRPSQMFGGCMGRKLGSCSANTTQISTWARSRRPWDGGFWGLAFFQAAGVADWMPVRISFLDFTYTLLGPAAALRAAGHTVSVFVPDNPFHTPGAHLAEYHAFLLDRCFGGGAARPDLDADVVIYGESFSDAYDALLRGYQLDAALPEDPLRQSIHPMALERRLDLFFGEWAAHPGLVLADMSDLTTPLHPVFRDHPGPRLKRECKPEHLPQGIAPYPFLFHPYLLALEMVGGLEGIRATAARQPVRDGWFCGTLRHPRYGSRRDQALVAIADRHPHARLEICSGGMPTSRNLAEMMASRTCLHPPGRGELCFRGHEASALGVPLLVDEPPAVVMPDAYRGMFHRRMEEIPTRAEVLRAYRETASPARAGETLLAGVNPPGTGQPAQKCRTLGSTAIP